MASSDPLADLDDLLNQLDNSSQKRASSIPSKKISSSSDEVSSSAVLPSSGAQSSLAHTPEKNNQEWKSQLDSLLNELSLSEPTSSSRSPSKPQSTIQSAVPVTSSPSSVPSYKETPSYATMDSTRVNPAVVPQQNVQVNPVNPAVSNVSEEIVFLPSRGTVELSPEEKALVQELNRVRTCPQVYADILERDRRPYFDGKHLKLPGSNVILVTEEGATAVDEAIRFLKNQKPFPPFSVSVGMTKAAKEAIGIVGPSGDTACESIQRFEQYGKFEQEAVEIASFGTKDAKEIVMRFLICDGNSERIQRTYIFEPIYKAIGVAIGSHNSAYRTMACVNFTKNFIEKE